MRCGLLAPLRSMQISSNPSRKTPKARYFAFRRSGAPNSFTEFHSNSGRMVAYAASTAATPPEAANRMEFAGMRKRWLNSPPTEPVR